MLASSTDCERQRALRVLLLLGAQRVGLVRAGDSREVSEERQLDRLVLCLVERVDCSRVLAV